jgi:hypothetical protein
VLTCNETSFAGSSLREAQADRVTKLRSAGTSLLEIVHTSALLRETTVRARSDGLDYVTRDVPAREGSGSETL